MTPRPQGLNISITTEGVHQCYISDLETLENPSFESELLNVAQKPRRVHGFHDRNSLEQFDGLPKVPDNGHNSFIEIAHKET